ncbi:MAG: hypothetical protein APF81_13970 [Desulfosporosinus sp. BRH_c37]|nr:MAG: hypothetical protein APF81_13970 [Desulfosporosinus sp. BRH_c37]
MKRLAVVLVLLWLMFSFASQAMAAENKLTISPGKVDVSLNFKGTTLNISGSVPDNAGVYIKVSSPNDSILDLSKKGKVSMFWMNVENTSVTKVPKLYQVLSSRPLSDLPEDLQEKLGINQNFSVVFQAAEVRKHSESGSVKLEKSEAKEFISSLVTIYKKARLYGLNESAVQVNDGHFNASLQLPANTPQEKCNVTVYFTKGGEVIGTSNGFFNVETVGIVKWLNNEAIYDGPTYGFLAVMIALMVGAAIAFLFICLENWKKPQMTKMLMNSEGGH